MQLDFFSAIRIKGIPSVNSLGVKGDWCEKMECMERSNYLSMFFHF